jgi:hypothetical protein
MDLDRENKSRFHQGVARLLPDPPGDPGKHQPGALH